MTTYLVLVRIPSDTNPEGDMSIYAAHFDTPEEAFKAVKADLPHSWIADRVIGPATDGLHRIMALKKGHVEPLASSG